MPRLGEWTRLTEGPVWVDQSYCRLREWTRWIEGPVRADQSHCRLDVYGLTRKGDQVDCRPVRRTSHTVDSKCMVVLCYVMIWHDVRVWYMW